MGNLADGSSATCAELDALIAVDREAIQFEKNDIDALEDIESEKSYMIDALFGNDKDKVEATKNRLKKQVSKLKKIRKDKVCETSGANLRQATDYEVYKRADEDVLNTARVIERAKAGKLVDGSGATCSELRRSSTSTRRPSRSRKTSSRLWATLWVSAKPTRRSSPTLRRPSRFRL